jgi:glycosyltransferase involved in cell wall biosynthesis
VAEAAPPRGYVVVEWSGGGGFGHYGWLLADAVAGRGRPTVLATRRTHELGDMPHRHRVARLWPDRPRGGVRARTARIAAGWALGWCRAVAHVAARRREIEAVHVQGGDRIFELPFLLAIRATGVTLVATAHNPVRHDTGLLAGLANRLLYRVMHGVVVHTEGAAAQVRRLAGGRPGILVVPHPSYAPIADHLAPAAAGTVPGGPPRVAHLGTIRPYKGLDRVVQAVAAAQRAGFPDIRLTVAGWPGETDVEAAVADLVPGSADLELGHLPLGRLVAAAGEADVVMLGHRSTSESGVAHLALGAGTVVIGPRMGAIAGLLAPEPGWLYDPEDPADALRALRDALRDVRDDPRACGRRARAVADAVVSWDESARRTLEFAGSLRAGRRG